MTSTATLYNSTAADAAGAPKRRSALPPAVRRIVVVGGGSAGWMTALRIEESEWMPECHATYKCGITFDGWSTKPGFERYFHPFASMLDNLTMTQFVHNVDARINGTEVYAHPDRFFIASRLAAKHLAPKPAEHFPFDIWHGYHFDSVLLGQYLHKKALQRGVRYLTAHVTHANLDEHGAIASLGTREGPAIAGDLFVDCTGFAGLLITQALKTPFVSFAENLFNDAAIAMPTPIETRLGLEDSAHPAFRQWLCLQHAVLHSG